MAAAGTGREVAVAPSIMELYPVIINVIIPIITSKVIDLFGGWGAQGFPTPEVDLPSLDFLKLS